jgi:hypothetical protein
MQIRPDLILTARENIGRDMGYLKITNVALFDNVYTNFNFVHSSYNLKLFFISSI